MKILKTRRFTTQKKELIQNEHLVLGRTEEGQYIIAWERDIFRHVNGFTHLLNPVAEHSNRDLAISHFESLAFDCVKKTIKHFRWTFRPAKAIHINQGAFA